MLLFVLVDMILTLIYELHYLLATLVCDGEGVPNKVAFRLNLFLPLLESDLSRLPFFKITNTT